MNFFPESYWPLGWFQGDYWPDEITEIPEEVNPYEFELGSGCSITIGSGCSITVGSGCSIDLTV